MDEINKGEFLQEKMLNMAAYVQDGVGMKIEGLEGQITPIRAVAFCQELAKHKVFVTHRNWQGIVSAPGMPAYMQDLVVAVRANEELHAKFWRYLELFVSLG